jgi:hypothetical protein
MRHPSSVLCRVNSLATVWNFWTFKTGLEYFPSFLRYLTIEEVALPHNREWLQHQFKCQQWHEIEAMLLMKRGALDTGITAIESDSAMRSCQVNSWLLYCLYLLSPNRLG